VFQVTPAGATSILYAFTGAGDGAYPYAGVIQANDGNFYGTSESSGAFGGGTAFRLTTRPSLVTWNTPTSIVYGTPLGAAQLNATASVPGVFTYTPPAGTVLHAGLQTLTVSFTPTDTALPPTTRTVTLTVTQATPVVIWTPPASIVYGTPLSSTQLRARANVEGTFTYDPPAGAVVAVGSQALSATFTPADAVDYTTVTRAVTLDVTQATPVITWYPAAIASGMALGPAQLNATANTGGTGDDTLSAVSTIDSHSRWRRAPTGSPRAEHPTIGPATTSESATSVLIEFMIGCRLTLAVYALRRVGIRT
jgi:hypothetical protein